MVAVTVAGATHGELGGRGEKQSSKEAAALGGEEKGHGPACTLFF